MTSRLTNGTPTPMPLWLAGFLATLLYAAAGLYFEHVASIAEPVLALLGFWCVFRYGTGLPRTTAFMFLWAALAIQLLSWTGSQFYHPELAEPYPKLDRLARLFVFLLLAWWLGGQPRNVFLFWAVAAAGLLVSPWVLGFGHEQFLLGLEGRRISLNLRNAQHTAIFYGTLMIGLLLFLPRMISAFRYWIVLPWALVFTLTLTGVAFTQTRAVWSGLLIVLLTLPFLVLLLNREKLTKKFLVGLILLLLTSVSVLGLAFSPYGPERLQAEQNSIEQILAGELDNLAYSSVGTRIHSWRAALELSSYHPVIGWGGNARGYTLAQTEWIPADKAERYQHLHNSYLELLVQYGVIGLAWYLLLLGWLTKATLSAWRNGSMPGDIALFFGAFVIFWIWVNVFESYLGFSISKLLMNLVFAGVLTFIWKDHFRRMEATG